MDNRPLRYLQFYLVALLFGVCLIPFSYLSFFKRVPVHHALVLAGGVAALFSLRSFPRYFQLLLSFALTLFISSAFSIVDKTDSLKAAAGLVFRGLIPAAVAYTLVKNGFNTHKILDYARWIGLIVAVTALYELLTGHFFLISRDYSHMGPNDYMMPIDRFASGIFAHPFTLSAFLNLIFPLQLATAFKQRKWLPWITTALIALTIVLTFRRSGLILMVLTSVTFFVYSKNVKTLLGVLAGVVTIVLFVGSVTHFKINLKERFAVTYTLQEFKEGYRMRAYKAVVSMFKERPLTGIGIGQYPVLEGPLTAYRYDRKPTDNQYARMLAEGGLLGLLGLMAVLFYPFLLLRRGALSGEIFAPVAGIISFLLVLCLSDLLLWPATQVLFFVLHGAVAAHLDT